MTRNPSWTEEEIILATELYVRSGGRVLGPSDPDVIELSEFLNRLRLPDNAKSNEKFRNPSGVGMKLSNIRAADPNRKGGSSHGSRLDGMFWEELGGDEQELFRLAREIRHWYRDR